MKVLLCFNSEITLLKKKKKSVKCPSVLVVCTSEDGEEERKGRVSSACSQVKDAESTGHSGDTVLQQIQCQQEIWEQAFCLREPRDGDLKVTTGRWFRGER